MQRRWGLFPKYATLIVSLVGGTLFASAAVGLYFSYREIQEHLAALQTEKAQGAAARIEGFVLEIQQQLGWTALLRTDSPREALEARRLEYIRLLRQVPAVTEVAWIDADGKDQLRLSRVAMDTLGGGADQSSQLGFRAASAGHVHYSEVNFRKETEPYMTIWHPTGGVGKGADGRPRNRDGVTVAEVNLKLVRDVVSRIKIGNSGVAYVIDSSGTLIAHPDISLVLQKTDMKPLPQVAALWRQQDEPLGKNLEGKDVFSAHAAIPTLHWTVFVESPRSEALAPLYTSILRLAMVLAAGLLVAMVASFVLARALVRPLRALQAGAARIGRGELEQRIEVRTGDEIEGLAEQFNKMGADLHASYTDLERQVQERTRQLERANKHKSEFLAHVSHELRTPLNAIIGFSEVLTERMFGDLNEKQMEYLQDIHSSGRHLLTLINDILDLSKIEAGRMDLELATFDLRALLDNCMMLVQEMAGRNGLTLRAEIEREIGQWGADERKVKQIVINLLSNAVKFTPAGGSVTLRARHVAAHAGDAEPAQIEIEVSDTGVGIAHDQQAKVFEEFRQAGGDYLRKSEGTGLGLSLAKGFVELHGGSIRLQSAPGQGSTFAFVLPRRVPEAA